MRRRHGQARVDEKPSVHAISIFSMEGEGLANIRCKQENSGTLRLCPLL